MTGLSIAWCSYLLCFLLLQTLPTIHVKPKLWIIWIAGDVQEKSILNLRETNRSRASHLTYNHVQKRRLIGQKMAPGSAALRRVSRIRWSALVMCLAESDRMFDI